MCECCLVNRSKINLAVALMSAILSLMQFLVNIYGRLFAYVWFKTALWVPQGEIKFYLLQRQAPPWWSRILFDFRSIKAFWRRTPWAVCGLAVLSCTNWKRPTGSNRFGLTKIKAVTGRPVKLDCFIKAWLVIATIIDETHTAISGQQGIESIPRYSCWNNGWKLRLNVDHTYHLRWVDSNLARDTLDSNHEQQLSLRLVGYFMSWQQFSWLYSAAIIRRAMKWEACILYP